MDECSVPDAEKRRLAEAWLRARYHVDVDGTHWPLRIGAAATAFEQAAKARGEPARSWLLITAWNPPGTQHGDAANLAADLRLQQVLDDAVLRRLPAFADDDHGDWREPGWLVADVGMEYADRLMRQFRQGGVLFWRAGEAVTLRLAWSRPTDAPECDYIVWTG